MVSGFLQAGMIPELFEQDRGDRKEDHAGYADRLVTSVEGKKRDGEDCEVMLAPVPGKGCRRRASGQGRGLPRLAASDRSGRCALRARSPRPR